MKGETLPDNIRQEIERLWTTTQRSALMIAADLGVSSNVVYRYARENPEWKRPQQTIDNDEVARINAQVVANFLQGTDRNSDSLLAEMVAATKAPVETSAQWVDEQLRKLIVEIPVAIALTARSEWVKNAGNIAKLLEIANAFTAKHLHGKSAPEDGDLSLELPPPVN